MERAGARRVHIGGDRGHSALMLWILYCQGLVIIAVPALRFPVTRTLDGHHRHCRRTGPNAWHSALLNLY